MTMTTEKRMGYYVKLLPQTIRAVKALSKVLDVPEVEVLELGLKRLFIDVNSTVSEMLGVEK